jgi:flagellar M-ring protein FliF
VALTRPAEGEPGAVVGARLELKKETETYLAKKAAEVLKRSFGEGQALVSVDVTLNMDEIKTTTEEVISAPARAGAAPTGVVVKERESVRDAAAPLDGGAKGGSSMQREVDYQVGRRVEQVVAQPGSIRRIQVVAVVKAPLKEDEINALKATLGASVGASIERGDSVVVQALGGAASDKPAPAVIDNSVAPQDSTAMREPLVAAPPVDQAFMLLGALAVLAAGLAVGFGVACVTRRAPQTLGEADREALLVRVNRWLDADGAAK